MLASSGGLEPGVVRCFASVTVHGCLGHLCPSKEIAHRFKAALAVKYVLQTSEACGILESVGQHLPSQMAFQLSSPLEHSCAILGPKQFQILYPSFSCTICCTSPCTIAPVTARPRAADDKVRLPSGLSILAHQRLAGCAAPVAWWHPVWAVQERFSNCGHAHRMFTGYVLPRMYSMLVLYEIEMDYSLNRKVWAPLLKKLVHAG